MTRHEVRGGILTLASVLLIGACGGGGGPSKSQYIERADRICHSTRAQAAPSVQRVASAAAGLPTGAGARKLAPTVERLHRIGQRYLSRLQALEQPSEDEAAIDRFLEPTRRVVDAIGRAGRALSGSHVLVAVGILQQSQPLADEANAAAEAYGLKQCGSILSSSG